MSIPLTFGFLVNPPSAGYTHFLGTPNNLFVGQFNNVILARGSFSGDDVHNNKATTRKGIIIYDGAYHDGSTYHVSSATRTNLGTKLNPYNGEKIWVSGTNPTTDPCRTKIAGSNFIYGWPLAASPFYTLTSSNLTALYTKTAALFTTSMPPTSLPHRLVLLMKYWRPVGVDFFFNDSEVELYAVHLNW